MIYYYLKNNYSFLRFQMDEVHILLSWAREYARWSVFNGKG